MQERLDAINECLDQMPRELREKIWRMTEEETLLDRFSELTKGIIKLKECEIKYDETYSDGEDSIEDDEIIIRTEKLKEARKNIVKKYKETVVDVCKIVRETIPDNILARISYEGVDNTVRNTYIRNCINYNQSYKRKHLGINSIYGRNVELMGATFNI